MSASVFLILEDFLNIIINHIDNSYVYGRINLNLTIDLGFEREANQLESSEWQKVQEHIERMLDTLKYGSITLVVQGGKIVQIEKNEKVRLQSTK